MKQTILILLMLSACTLFFSCSNAETPLTYDCTGVTPTYSTVIKPILDANCATSGCHNSTNRANGYDFSTYSSVKMHCGSNNFMGSMQHLSGYKSMPEGRAKLSDETLKQISCWIKNGSPQ